LLISKGSKHIYHHLSRAVIQKNYNDFVCSYGCENVSAIISTSTFKPETFYVSQKRRGEKLIFFDDVDFYTWVMDMIKDVCQCLPIVGDISDFYDIAYKNVITLLNYENTAKKIACQEFIDIVRRVVAYTLIGDVNAEIDTAKKFNNLVDTIMPEVLAHFSNSMLTLKELLLFSILSGLSGLDVKGAPAAVSKYSGKGLPMLKYFSMFPHQATQDYIFSLKNLYNECDTSLYDFASFENVLVNKKQLIWMTDDYIESHFDLLVISLILKRFSISVTIIPKNGRHGNDLCYADLKKMISSDLVPELSDYLNTGRLKISSLGPKMGAANIRKLSKECIDLMSNADVIFMKGCRIHEMLQGGLNIDSFSSFTVVRHFTEISSGVTITQKAALLIHLAPKEYSFWGTRFNDAVKMGEETQNYRCTCTTKDHFRRKQMYDIETIVNEFTLLKKILAKYNGDKRPVYQEMNILAEKIAVYTTQQYNLKSNTYSNLKRPDVARIDCHMWEALVRQIKKHIDCDLHNVLLLDAGTGDGCAIEKAINLGMKVLGLDNSTGFIETLIKKEKQGVIPPNSFVMSDMCSMDCIEDNTFDVVRMNASLSHLPIISCGYTVDLALSEAYRVLKMDGLIFISVKAGEGHVLIDTNEGLGKRFYQMYSHENLNVILTRNGFVNVDKIDAVESRNQNTIHWIAHIAQKVKK